ncbi:hypothetical protein PENFLA_c016G01716 [Penicillium flavigenum]|uniref:Uncharacterized protein n=1 Tax=Penicillium flavigenum TaxID=254877 RepID=A0A1V6T4D4_9EURO|nr:hypothetical protein PENFLA_c016G01716 [Penicillium flavigenum]
MGSRPPDLYNRRLLERRRKELLALGQMLLERRRDPTYVLVLRPRGVVPLTEKVPTKDLPDEVETAESTLVAEYQTLGVRVKVTLQPFHHESELLELDGREFSSWADTYGHCRAYHTQPDDRYGRVSTTPQRTCLRIRRMTHEEEDEPPGFLAGFSTARNKPRPCHPPPGPDRLGERDVDRAYDWTPHMDRNMDLHIPPDYWKEAYPRSLRYLKPDLTLPLAPAG